MCLAALLALQSAPETSDAALSQGKLKSIAALHSSWPSERQGSAWLSLGIKCRFAEEASCQSTEQGSSGTSAVVDVQQTVMSGMPVQQAPAYERDSTSDKLCKDLNEAACTGDLAHFDLSRSGPHLSVIGPLQLSGGMQSDSRNLQELDTGLAWPRIKLLPILETANHPCSKAPELTLSLPLTGSRLQR